MLKKVFLFLLLGIIAITSDAQQKYTIDNVRKVYLRNNGEIIEKNEIKGYFAFYVSDKVSKKVNEYTLQILDNNLNKIKDIVFEDDSKVQILESSYNGNSIMFLFYNSSEKTLEYRAYGFDGKQKMTYTKELTKRSKLMIDQVYYYNRNSDEGQNNALFSVEDRGYVTCYPVKEGKYHSYEVHFFFTNQRKQWSYEAAEEQDDKYAMATYLGATDSLVILEVIKQRSAIASGGPHSWLVGLNIFNGKKVFEMSTEKEDYKFYPMNVCPIRGKSEFMLVGAYYDLNSKILKEGSLGLAKWTMNNKGVVSAKKYNSWETDIAKYLPVDKKGRVSDIGYIYFHKILQTADGKYFAVGEGYKKVASAMGIASTILNRGGGGTSNLKLKITDIVTFGFNEQFEIEDAKIYDKYNNSLEMPGGAELLSPHTMALLAKAYGAFDYSFTQVNNDYSKFNVGYLDYEKSGDEKGLYFHSIGYSEGKFTTDKISLKTKAKWTAVYPAKPGFVTILEYFKKDKRLEFRLEKLN